MDENGSQRRPPPTPTPSPGCFARGCLTVAVVGVILMVLSAVIYRYVEHDLEPYLSQEPATIRVYPATDSEYQTLEAKVSTFVQMVEDGRRATLTLTADELNTLVARDPRYASLRGKAYFAIANQEVSAETSLLLNEQAPTDERTYFHGRAVFDASFSSGDFTAVLRRLEPLGGGPAPGMVRWAVDQPTFSDNFSQWFNGRYHDILKQNPGSDAFFHRLHTIIVEDNRFVITALDAPGAVAGKADLR